MVAEADANLREAAVDTTTGTSPVAVAIAAAALSIAAAAVAAAALDTAITLLPLMVASAAWMAPSHRPQLRPFRAKSEAVALPAADRMNSCGCAGVGTTRLRVKRHSSHSQASAMSSGAAAATAVAGAAIYCNGAASVASVQDACTETTRCAVSVRAAAAGGAAGLTGAALPALLAGCAATDSAGPAAIAAATAAASQTTLAAALLEAQCGGLYNTRTAT